MQLRTLLGTVAALAVTAVVGLGLASPALATYGPESGSATVSANNVGNGGTVTVSGDGLLPSVAGDRDRQPGRPGLHHEERAGEQQRQRVFRH